MISLVLICAITGLGVWQVKKRPYFAVGRMVLVLFGTLVYL